MGRGRKGTGVQMRDASIRIRFTYRGERFEETLDLKPTPANAKYAARLVKKIYEEIERGTFSYEATFPDSTNAKRPDLVPELRSFGHYCQLYLESKGRAAEATKSQYRNALQFWKKHIGAEKAINTVNHAELAAPIGAHPWPSWRLCNNYLIPLRGAFKLACRALQFENPLQDIENMPRVKKLPDPLAADEAEMVLADLVNHYDERVFLYFEFAFQTGMRPEEIIALRWGDVDWNNKTIRVERARTFRGTLKAVKTGEERDVDLSPRALAALNRMKKHTFMLKAEIFQNPVTGKPWHDERSQREHYWNPALLRCGIRRRRAYATRHTYATRMVMGGAKPAYVANQLGHSLQMLYTTYARWINSADKGQEASKLAAILGEFGPNLGPRCSETRPSD